MGKYVTAGKTSDFADGAMKKVSIEGQDILVARIGSNYYAIGNKCPHLGGDLSKGTLEGTVVTCPLHGSQFDLRDGKNVRWLKGSGMASAIGKVFKPPKPVPSYKVKAEGTDISVEV